MATILVILTLVFIAYVGYILVSDSHGGAKVDEVRAPEAPNKPATAKVAATRPQADPPKRPAAVKREEAPQPKEKSEVTASSDEAEPTLSGLRNPSTGELAAVPSNYRFAKRWIKEAMVSEGLLDRIYKNNELSGANGDKAKQALENFKALKKYHG